MTIKKMICKITGHKKGFLHKDNEHYHYICLRCGDKVVEEIIYGGQKSGSSETLTAKN